MCGRIVQATSPEEIAREFGAVLADDMGLGKTATTLAHLLDRPGPHLVVCPLSVVRNWEKESARFAPSLSVHVYHGSDRATGDEAAELLGGHDLVITTLTAWWRRAYRSGIAYAEVAERMRRRGDDKTEILHVAEVLRAQLPRPMPEAPQWLKDKVAKGELGKKTGKGLYEWKNGHAVKEGGAPHSDRQRHPDRRHRAAGLGPRAPDGR